MRAIFDLRDAPFDSSFTRLRRKGVVSAPWTPFSSASLSADSMACSTSMPFACSSLGIGTPTRSPPGSPRERWACIARAITAGLSALKGARHPDLVVKNAGNSSVPYAKTGTPSVSSTSSVRRMSKIDFTPAHTTVTPVWLNSVRSALTSIESSPPRCTPPIPPVTNTGILAFDARKAVPDTVVAPFNLLAMTYAMSRLDVFLQVDPAFPNSSKAFASRPMWTLPSKMAMVAGVAP
mmetsp:Transcript_34769/g.90188  ORF Transcript_34769/g.90188 Transcript_34769/m.90188 type:complete len:236 (-) Transcript_34769:241-948(-)